MLGSCRSRQSLDVIMRMSWGLYDCVNSANEWSRYLNKEPQRGNTSLLQNSMAQVVMRLQWPDQSDNATRVKDETPRSPFPCIAGLSLPITYRTPHCRSISNSSNSCSYTHTKMVQQ